jgi:polysaccharide export outer membrane protein
MVKDTVINTAMNLQELKIKKPDILGISISSLSIQEDEIFNKAAAPAASGGTSSSGNFSSAGFPVDLEGNIYLHKIGKLRVEGMTRNELKKQLESLLQPYLKDPVVSIVFNNHFITVIGEVGRPQLLNMPNESMPLPT